MLNALNCIHKLHNVVRRTSAYNIEQECHLPASLILHCATPSVLNRMPLFGGFQMFEIGIEQLE